MNKLENMVKEKALGIYANAGRVIVEAAIAECAKMGLGHTAAKDLLQYAVSSDPKVPESAQVHLMSRIVSAIEIAADSDKEKAEKLKNALSSAGENGGSQSVAAGGLDVGAAVADGAKSEIEQIQKVKLSDMPIGELRKKAASLGVETVTPEGKNVARKDLELAILAGEGH